MKRLNLIGRGVVITTVLAGGAARAGWTPPESSATPPAVVSVYPFAVPDWNGASPNRPLVVGPDGALYGSTSGGGTGGGGTLFRVETNGTFTKLHDFDSDYNYGAVSPSALVVGPDSALYGSTGSGGTNGYGTLFRLTTDGTFTKLHDFNGTDGNAPDAALVVGPDGALYGPTRLGGTNGYGTLFRLTTDGTFTKLHDFNVTDADYPSAALVVGPDGALYGSTSSILFGSPGTLFRLTTDGTFTKLHDFNGTDGDDPSAALVVGPDGALYGSTQNGGITNNGTLFRMETNGTFTKLHDFNGTDGSHPNAALVVGPDGALYGSTYGGTLFRVTTNGTFTKLHDSNGADGLLPQAPLVVGANGALYGSTYRGGTNFDGTLFRLTTDGTFTKLHDFNGTDGANPYADLVVGPDGALYGSALYGGVSGVGTLFRLTTNGTFNELHDFNYSTAGESPFASLVMGPDGALYGSTFQGGAYDSDNSSIYYGDGTLFRVETNGNFTKLHDFNGADGLLPQAPLVVGPDGALYGSATQGGTHLNPDDGTLFRLATDGTFTKLHGFYYYTDGSQPNALVVGPDGALYGSTRYGGTNDYIGYGTLFRLSTDGTFTDLHDFHPYLDGAHPFAPMVVGPDGALYGSGNDGGASDDGTLFRLETNGTFTKLHDFNGADGLLPQAPLVVGPDGALYGSTDGGGAHNYGTLFRLTTGGTFTKLHDFDGTNGANPLGALVMGPDGALYGSTANSGASYQVGYFDGYGMLFRLTTDGTFTKLHDFNGTDGDSPQASLVVGPDGALYGSTYLGGASDKGTLFRLTTDGTFTKLFDFAGTNGANPDLALLAGPGHALYGATMRGGPRGGGAVFKLVLDHPPMADASATPALVLSPNGTNATVVLDGSRSSDPDGKILLFTWSDAGAASPLASGVVALSVLPVGTNSIGLVVNDGQLSDTNSATIAVMTATGAVNRLVDLLNTDPSAAQTFATTLTAALTSIDRGDPASAINQLILFQNQVQAQVQPLDSNLAASLNQAAQDTIDSLNEDLANPDSPSHGQFTAVSRQTNGVVQLQFSGVSGLSYVVEASRDLRTWEMIGVATPLAGGQFEFEDSQTGSFGQRFYRLVLP